MSVSRSIHRKMMDLAAAFGHDQTTVLSWLKMSCRQHGCLLQPHPYVWTLRKGQRVIRFAPRHYANIPYIASRFDVFFASLVPEVKGSDLILDFSHVHTSTYRALGVTLEFSSYPEEEDVLDALLAPFKPSKDEMAFDIGTHGGLSTYVLSQLAGQVIAFEPDPLSFNVLQRNIDRHSLLNVTAVKKLPVLEEAFLQWGIPSFCKIEAFGAEVDMLTTAQNVLAQCRTSLAIRSTHETLGISNQSKVEALLQECGFEINSNAELGTTTATPT